MEYYKTYCTSHPYEAVTNFCADSDCLVGLCATCICEHTQQHMKRGTAPQYENIKNTFVKYCERMRDQIERIEYDKEWLSAVGKSIEEKKQNLREVLSHAREQTIAAVHGYFDQLEGNIENEIAADAKKNGLHAAYRLQTLNTLLSKEISNLLLYSKDLASPKFLESVRQVDREVLPGSSEFHSKISKQLKENQVYTASAIFREDLLSDVTYSLKRLVNLEFVLPQMSTYLEQTETSRRANSLKKTNSSLLVRSTQPSNDLTKVVRNFSGILSPNKKTTSVVMPTPPIQQILAMSGLYNRNQPGTPTIMSKGSRLSSGLKIIRQTKRQNVPNDQVQSFTSSRVSYNKQNDLAQSTYCDTGSNFFR